MIELTSIRKSFGDKDVLTGLNLNLKENEWLSVVGPSGCGKTTMLNI
ncbi:MAG: multiple sugar transport system ATP-binding protein, partial [Thermoproteota archaeon]|nr:multiple sugar transport system ATP-binding protein [Thermoproteota archaeon]